jgi:polyhydroxyalkanoate synthesis regulator phasin
MTLNQDAHRAEKLYHHLVGKMKLTPEQKQTLWQELMNWYGVQTEDSQAKGSAREQVHHLIQNMG